MCKADEYRAFAKEVRAVDERLKSDNARNELLQIAAAWDKMAADKERRSAH